ncbi:MAG: OmpA family protein [Ignavibacteriaceae bacterium]|nr:OmpA family protein [Ignavibacteriaceae bacterium]
MKKKIYFIRLVEYTIICFLLINTSLAQFNDYSLKTGIQFNGLFPDTEFEKELKVTSADFKFSYMGRIFLRTELIKNLIETEVGVGYGTLAGVDFNNKEYKTEIIPIDLRLILSPFNIKFFNPYGYAGAGFLKYKVKTFPLSVSPNPDVKNSNWSVFVPIGAGFEIALSEEFVLDLNGGYAFTFTDDLNYYSNKNSYPGVSTVYDGFYNASIGFSYVGGSGNSDKDMDGLVRKIEKEIATDPNNADTDGDGLKDGEEVNTYKSNPLITDTDGDGLKDSDEVKLFNTNPSIADTDSDGLNDGVEVNMYKTNPSKADSDLDNLNDNDELVKYKTDPLKSDTDGEGLTDGDEIKKYKTDPLKTDSDSDGLFDGEEIVKYKINPLKKDSDSGTVDDLTELTRGTNPLDADDDVIKIGVPIILEGVTFEKGKWDITPESSQILRSSLKTLTTYPDIHVEISGHTDNVGSKKSNIKLSQKRAESVRDWLIERGIDPSRITAVGHGPNIPIAPNDTQENKRKNRRIEFKRTK